MRLMVLMTMVMMLDHEAEDDDATEAEDANMVDEFIRISRIIIILLLIIILSGASIVLLIQHHRRPHHPRMKPLLRP